MGKADSFNTILFRFQAPEVIHKYDYIRHQSDYQVPPPPRPVEKPFLVTGLTGSGSGSSPENPVATSDDNDDVFVADRFGTMRASDAIAARKKMTEDYRHQPSKQGTSGSHEEA